jgi:hypothetical protein
VTTSSDGVKCGLTAAEIEHAIRDAQKLIELMGAEHHRNASLATVTPDEVDHDLLVLGVETDQRLVEKEQPRRPEQRLCQQEALPFATGHLGHRPVGQIPRVRRR